MYYQTRPFNEFKAWAMLGPRDPYALAAFESRWSRFVVVREDGGTRKSVGWDIYIYIYNSHENIIKPQRKT